MSYIGSKPANKPVVASDLDPTVITGQTALAVAPADTDEFLISDAGTLKRIDASLVGGGGITMADQFRLTADLSANGDITGNLERCNTGIQGTLGSSLMSESSGIFTFPSTGVYEVSATGSFIGASENAMQLIIHGTADNSSYATLAIIFDGQRNSTATSGGSSGCTIVNITNTSLQKIKFAAGSLGSGSALNGDGDNNQTMFTFIRLGDNT